MKKLFKDKNRVFIYSIYLFFILFNIVVFQSSFSLLLIDIYNFFYTFIFYYATLLGIEIKSPETYYSLFIAHQSTSLIPPAGESYFNDLFFRIGTFFNMIFSKNYYVVALPTLINVIQKIVLSISFLIIIILLIYILVELYLTPSKKDKKVGYTKSYLLATRIYKNTIRKYLDWFHEVNVLSTNERKFIKYSIIFVIIIDFRLISLGIELYSYFLIGVCTFSIESIYWALRTMSATFNFILSKCPLCVLILILLYFFDKIKIYLAKKKLTKFDDKNKEFADKLGILISVLGFPGSGKTTMCVSLCQLYEEMQRNAAFDIMSKYYHKFLEFNRGKYNLYLNNIIKAHDIKNRVQLREFLKNDILCSTESIQAYFSYDLKRRKSYYDGLINDKLIPALIAYSEAYFYYYSAKPRLYTNLTINLFYRIDNNSNSSFPLFNYTYFDDHDSDNKLQEECHRSSSLNLGFLSLGKKENKNIGCIDSGLMFFTEADKEFGNRLTNSGVDRNSKKINVYNRLSEVYLMLCRHLHTIDTKPFFKYITDYQRDGSLSTSYAGITETTIEVQSGGTVKNLIPFRIYGRILSEFFVSILEKFLNESLKKRQVKGLIDLFLGKIYVLIAKHYYYRINTFNCTIKTMSVQGHSEDMPNKFYFLRKKIYSNAFKTDCYRDFFKDMYLDPERIFDSQEFLDDYPSKTEFDSMNSIFINKLESYDGLKNVKDIKKERKKKSNKKKEEKTK